MYSTYLGGSDDDRGFGIAVNSSGNAYVTGWTYSSDFPTVGPIDGTWNGSYDAFVTKLNTAGSALVYSTYLGGSEEEVGSGIAIDSSGNAYVTGWTESSDFPTASPFDGTCGGCPNFIDAFVTKLNASGSALDYSTYLGGSSSDLGHAIAVDFSGSAYVTGWTESHDFPIANPIDGTCGGCSYYNDVFVTKLNPAGSALDYSTYLGGSAGDSGNGIAIDSSGNAYVTGYTNSSNFPTASPIDGTYNGGYLDAFVAKILPVAKTWFEETDAMIAYTGAWFDYICNGCYADAVKVTNKKGAEAAFIFEGTGFSWYATKAKQLGKANVYVDGVLSAVVDLYNPTTRFRQQVFTKEGLAHGAHTVEIKNSGLKNTRATGVNVDIDAFEVVP
ncbi:MAG: SBBP repeat-containing protein [Deltaproteobacteria bacterium]|nr:SBBP repeat-containing protein [Deltaproteobacteria bacterium]